MSTPAPAFPRLQISQLEGRGQSTRYKQTQFQRLFEALTKSASAVKLAIQADSGHSPTEVDLEFILALSELRTLYESLDLAKELKTLRNVPSGRDNIERTRPVGIVYIVPATWCLFYSAISPLGSAIAAGNCVVLELPQTLSQTSSILRKVLTESMDADIFAISSSRHTAADFTSQCTLVLQGDEEFDNSKWSQVLRSPGSSYSVMVVDRTADVIKAAGAVASSNFAFRGRSLYSPRLVLVNEFVADQFLSALLAHVTDPSPAVDNELIKVNGHAASVKGDRKLTREYEKDENSKILVSGSNGKIVEALSRDSSLLLKKLDGPFILVHRISSLDDAINIFSGLEKLAACFVFGALGEANYVSTYINAYLSFINHIPAELMIGPIAPVHPCQKPAASPRYTPEMFIQPSPQYLHLKSPFDIALLGEKRDPLELKRWSAEVMKPLPEVKRPDGFLLNFFGTGIVIGLSTIALTVVGASAGACWFVYKVYRR